MNVLCQIGVASLDLTISCAIRALDPTTGRANCLQRGEKGASLHFPDTEKQGTTVLPPSSCFTVYEASVHCWIKPLLSTQIGIKKHMFAYHKVHQDVCIFFRFIIQLLRGNLKLHSSGAQFFSLFFFFLLKQNPRSTHTHLWPGWGRAAPTCVATGT